MLQQYKILVDISFFTFNLDKNYLKRNPLVIIETIVLDSIAYRHKNEKKKLFLREDQL